MVAWGVGFYSLGAAHGQARWTASMARGGDVLRCREFVCAIGCVRASLTGVGRGHRGR
jgi:hypothetical protein